MNLTTLAAIINLAFPPAATNALDSETTATLAVTNLFTNVKEITLTLTHDPLPDADLEIGIGTDANEDGTLDLLECAYVFASDCGVRTVRNARGGQAPTEGDAWTLTRREIDPRWNAIRLVRRGTGDLAESASARTRETGFAFILK